MPIYEYRCTSCGRSVDVIHSIHGTGPESCEVCGGVMRKALSAPAIVFKGSGWAKKDARSSPKPVAAGAKDGSPEASTSAADGAKETPAADSGTKEAAVTPPKASGTSTPDAPKPSGGAAKTGSTDRSA